MDANELFMCEITKYYSSANFYFWYSKSFSHTHSHRKFISISSSPHRCHYCAIVCSKAFAVFDE